jgi:predicted HTH transcriptional regulator
MPTCQIFLILPSTIRNKQIASALKDAGIIERYGSGIKRILEWFSMYGLGQPVFEELQEGFRVTIYRTTIFHGCEPPGIRRNPPADY